MVPQLRDYQSNAVEGIRQRFREGYRAPCLVVPTGGGKTIIFSYIAHQTADRGRRVLILVHRIELLRQTQKKLHAFGVRVGLISPKYAPDPYAPVQVAMVQTMIRRTHLYPDFDLIITDECHHVAANTYLQVINAYPAAFQLGVTATPVRTDGKGLGKRSGGIYDALVIGPTTRELIDRGFLVEPRVFAPPSLIDLAGVRRTGGDFNKKDLNERSNTRQVTGNAVDHYRSLCPHAPAVVFCVSVEHAKNVAGEFRAAGFRAFHADGGMEDAERSRILGGLADGSSEVVCSCDLISEGTDIPEIQAAILLRPTESFGLYLQQVGRALRPANGKEAAIILDHAGNTKHGLPTQEINWTLDGEIKAKRKKGDETAGPSVTICNNCFAVFESYRNACPSCGQVREVKATTIEQTDEQLKEISAAEAARINRAKRQEVGRARTLEELEAIAATRGYKPGWAKHVFNSRGGVPQ